MNCFHWRINIHCGVEAFHKGNLSEKMNVNSHVLVKFEFFHYEK